MKDFKVQIYNEERKEEWINAIGTDIVCVKSPIPKRVKINGEIKEAYFLDLDLLSSKQKEGLTLFFSKKFNLDKKYVFENLEKQGVPILKEDCLLIIENPQRWVD